MAVERPEYRLSDAERQDALDALSEHVRTGRLDLTEFDERSQQVSAAKFRRDLAPLFSDLPEPKPAVLVPGRALVPRQPVARPWQQRLAASAVPIAALLAVVLFFTVARGMIFVFLLPAIVAMVAGSCASHRHRRP
ncbi:DUF1707 domain-containing protein [Prauserella sp. PE36]|uniref:DUF1707 domain-containing protein n=1 Tax=Prauserella endophytica TaxID=1592324 RepID=A0ABY2RX91_9PSEU|nr:MULTISPECIES: DUF1707 domain-containing protein [Prauserella]PXY19794.1 hypothetical protein BAY59_32495 [Prauserella coralliicola]RBM23551.1 DUF1707 domain-containing protein [Prauserella sp. PE36]TKG64246.1 DUF1707 domain-containing protein [Prauserella endophytica]